MIFSFTSLLSALWNGFPSHLLYKMHSLMLQTNSCNSDKQFLCFNDLQFVSVSPNTFPSSLCLCLTITSPLVCLSLLLCASQITPSFSKLLHSSVLTLCMFNVSCHLPLPYFSLLLAFHWSVRWPCRDKFVETDLRPVCKHCYERFPEELKQRLARREREARDKRKKAAAICL